MCRGQAARCDLGSTNLLCPLCELREYSKQYSESVRYALSRMPIVGPQTSARKAMVQTANGHAPMMAALSCWKRRFECEGSTPCSAGIYLQSGGLISCNAPNAPRSYAPHEHRARSIAEARVSAERCFVVLQGASSCCGDSIARCFHRVPAALNVERIIQHIRLPRLRLDMDDGYVR